MVNPNPHYSHLLQIAVKEEATEGTEIDLDDAAFDRMLQDVSISPEIAKYAVEPDNQGDLGTVPPIIGSRAQVGSFTFLLKGTGDDADPHTDPEWGKWLRTAGIVKNELWTLPFDNGSGEYIDGEEFVGDVAATVRVLKAGTFLASGTVVVELITGSPADGETFTGAVGGATFDSNQVGAWPGNATKYGLLHYPDPLNSKASSIGVYYVYDTSASPYKATLIKIKGARGGLQITTPEGTDGPVLATVTPQGAHARYERVLSNDADNPFTITPTFQSNPALPFMGVSYTIQTITPTFENFDFNMNAELSFRKDANETQGIVYTRIPRYRPGGTINPEMLPVDTETPAFDTFTKITNVTGGTSGWILDDGSSGDYVELYMPATYIANYSIEDDEGIALQSLEYELHKLGYNGRPNRQFLIITGVDTTP